MKTHLLYNMNIYLVMKLFKLIFMSVESEYRST